MQPLNNQVLRLFFQKYNQAFAAAMDEILDDENALADLDPAEQDAALRHAACNAVQGWQDQPLSDDQIDLTGAAVLAGVVTLDKALELAKYAAVFCDEQFPDLVKVKLASFGQPLIEGLAAELNEVDFSVPLSELTEENNGPIVAAQYLRLLGEWQCADLSDKVIEKFASTHQPNEIMAEAVRAFLIEIGPSAVPRLLKLLNQSLSTTDDLNPTEDYLLIILTDIGKNCPSDEIFRCLREAFRKMSRKVIGAVCLGDYGDRRAVTTLRGWLERHPEVTDRQMISETLAAIHRLGGDIGDLRHRLKNPS